MSSTDRILRSFADLEEPRMRPEYARQLLDARVVFADYQLIQRDFPELAVDRLIAQRPEIAELPHGDRLRTVRRVIDEWLLQSGALISEQQTAPNEVNSPMRVGDARMFVCRPPLYGRSLVADLSEVRRCLRRHDIEPVVDGVPGLLDLKGAGIGYGVAPNLEMHGNGLMSLAEAIEEYAKQRLIERAFRHAGSKFRTVPAYAILYGGYDLLTAGDQRYPGAVLVRRGIRRLPDNADLPYYGSNHHRAILEIEFLLRHYGISSSSSLSRYELRRNDTGIELIFADKATENPNQEALGALWSEIGSGQELVLDTTNVQLTRTVLTQPSEAVLVDFSHYRVKSRFELPLLGVVRDRAYRWGGALRPGSEDFVQPTPELGLPGEEWVVEWSRDGLSAPDTSEVSPVGEDFLDRFPGTLSLAEAYGQGVVTGEQVRQAIEGLVDRTCARLGARDDTVRARARAAAEVVLAQRDIGLEVLETFRRRAMNEAQRAELAEVLQVSTDVLTPGGGPAGVAPAWEMLSKQRLVDRALVELGITEGLPGPVRTLLAFRALDGLRKLAVRAQTPEERAQIASQLAASATYVVRHVLAKPGQRPKPILEVARELVVPAASLRLGRTLRTVDKLLAAPEIQQIRKNLESELTTWASRVKRHLPEA